MSEPVPEATEAPPPPAAPPAAAVQAPAPDPHRAPAPRAGKGVIHDLGYARYAGERHSPSTLWRVIMRHQVSHTWKTWWRWKPWAILAVIITVSVGLVMYLSQDKMFDALRKNGAAVRFLDGLVPFSVPFFRLCAFAMTMTVASIGIARDRETGAFGFYFSRPVRARDYVLGKLAGMTLVMATLTLAGPLLLAAFRVGLADNTDEMIDLLPWLGRAALVGTLAAIVYAAVPMAFSAIIGRRWLALGLWAAYYVIISTMLGGIGYLSWPPLMAIDPAVAVDALAFNLWDLTPEGQKSGVTVTASIVSLGLHAVIAIGLLYWRIAKQATGAVGASS